MDRIFKCRFCDFETSNYGELIKHEGNCFLKQEKEFNRKQDEEIVEEVNKLNTLKQKYERQADMMIQRYPKEKLEKFKGVFPVGKFVSDNENINNKCTTTNNQGRVLDENELCQMIRQALNCSR
jgi:hypothetical protein